MPALLRAGQFVVAVVQCSMIFGYVLSFLMVVGTINASVLHDQEPPAKQLAPVQKPHHDRKEWEYTFEKKGTRRNPIFSFVITHNRNDGPQYLVLYIQKNAQNQDVLNQIEMWLEQSALEKGSQDYAQQALVWIAEALNDGLVTSLSECSHKAPEKANDARNEAYYQALINHKVIGFPADAERPWYKFW